jgi:hypothetical protein
MMNDEFKPRPASSFIIPHSSFIIPLESIVARRLVAPGGSRLGRGEYIKPIWT